MPSVRFSPARSVRFTTAANSLESISGAREWHKKWHSKWHKRGRESAASAPEPHVYYAASTRACLRNLAPAGFRKQLTPAYRRIAGSG